MADYNGPERRNGNGTQYSLGHLEATVTGLASKLEDHIATTGEYRRSTDGKLDTIVNAVQGLKETAAQRDGGLKMLAKIAGAGAGGGAVGAAILQWLGLGTPGS